MSRSITELCLDFKRNPDDWIELPSEPDDQCVYFENKHTGEKFSRAIMWKQDSTGGGKMKLLIIPLAAVSLISIAYIVTHVVRFPY